MSFRIGKTVRISATDIFSRLHPQGLETQLVRLFDTGIVIY